MKKIALSVCMLTLAAHILALSGCGGGGGGDEIAGDGGGGDEIAGGGGQNQFTGVASYSKLTTDYDPSSATSYTMSIDLDAFDAESKTAAELTGLTSTSVNLSVPGNPSATLGQQQYSLRSINCVGPSTQNSYDAMMLFDRSGSMNSNDPLDKSRDAGQEFVNSLGSADRAKIGEFRGQQDIVNYFTTMTQNVSELSSGIAGLRSFSMLTPLWDAMLDSLTKMPASNSRRALLAFSDGKDTESSSSSFDVEKYALGASVQAYAINLRNTDSQELDRIALATGGNVFSTDDAEELVSYYGVLGQILSGRSIKCQAQIDVAFTPAQNYAGSVGYGPAYGLKTDLLFQASAGSNSGEVISKLRLPLYPGRQIGSTVAGAPVYETDIIESNSASNCIDPNSTLTNNCTNTSVYVRACNGSDCTGGLLLPGKSISAPAGTYKWVSCGWSEEDHNKFIPVIRSGNIPNMVVREWDTEGEQYICSFAGRFELGSGLEENQNADDEFSSARGISDNTKISDGFLNIDSDSEDNYRFTASESGAYNFKFSTIPTVATGMALFDGSATAVGVSSFLTFSLGNSMTYNLVQGAEYIINVTLMGSDSGDVEYVLEVNKQ